jgi:hypothetical protein
MLTFRDVDVYIPICADHTLHPDYARLDGRSWWWLSIIARPKPDISIEQVHARLRVLAPCILKTREVFTWRI